MVSRCSTNRTGAAESNQELHTLTAERCESAIGLEAAALWLT
jgi:hypothetical protein